MFSSRIEFILASAVVSTVASQQVVGLIPSLVATPASSHRPKTCTLATPANSARSQVWTLICDEPAYQRASIAAPTVQHKWCQKTCTLLSKNVLSFFCLLDFWWRPIMKKLKEIAHRDTCECVRALMKYRHPHPPPCPVLFCVHQSSGKEWNINGYWSGTRWRGGARGEQ